MIRFWRVWAFLLSITMLASACGGAQKADPPSVFANIDEELVGVGENRFVGQITGGIESDFFGEIYVESLYSDSGRPTGEYFVIFSSHRTLGCGMAGYFISQNITPGIYAFGYGDLEVTSEGDLSLIDCHGYGYVGDYCGIDFGLEYMHVVASLFYVKSINPLVGGFEFTAENGASGSITVRAVFNGLRLR